jgi:DNA-binding NtrC family response regulator
MPEPTSVLLVMAPEARRQMLELLESLDGVSVLAADGCRQARSALEARPEVSVVLTGLSHADGNWSDLLRFAVNRGIEARIVVCAREADETLWSEVLWRGGYDVLVQPCRPSELLRVVQGAVHAQSVRHGARAAVA